MSTLKNIALSIRSSYANPWRVQLQQIMPNHTFTHSLKAPEHRTCIRYRVCVNKHLLHRPVNARALLNKHVKQL